MSTTVSHSHGIGVMGLLGVIFITLKVLEVDPVASWSWWLVTAPLWVPWLFAFGILCAAFLIAVWGYFR